MRAPGQWSPTHPIHWYYPYNNTINDTMISTCISYNARHIPENNQQSATDYRLCTIKPLTHCPLAGMDMISPVKIFVPTFRTQYRDEWITEDLFEGKSILVHVMAWCCQAASHYVIQCWWRFQMPYGVTRPQWENDTYMLYWKRGLTF